MKETRRDNLSSLDTTSTAFFSLCQSDGSVQQGTFVVLACLDLYKSFQDLVGRV